jgi:outer membrane biosynthesis protein TonB
MPVDRPVPPEVAEEEPKRSPETDKPEPVPPAVEEAPKQATSTPAGAPGSDPGFRGFQRRTELQGSISRQGRSALDVKSGPLGKYHAAIGRAIERAWQRQVVRNRDFITPGVLRIRVVLDEDGRVRSVGTVEEVGVGSIQKGFTHAAIREAELPEMPTEVKRELDGEPLELLYNFIF